MKHVFAFPLFCLKGNILWIRYLNTAGKINSSLLSLNIHYLSDSYSTLHLYFFKSFCRFGQKYPDKYLTNRGRQFWRFQSSGIWHHVNWYLGTTFRWSLLFPGTGSPVSENFVTSVFRVAYPWNTGIHLRITWFRVLEDWEFHQRRCENLATTFMDEIVCNF
jgi:hypothetical protein